MGSEALRAQMERPVPRGRVRFEVIAGPSGPCLTVAGDNRGGTRIAGPKPWGGGLVTHVFDVDIADLLSLVQRIEARSTDTGGEDG